MSSSYSLLLPYLSLVCCILPCHHPHCIFMFSKRASVRVSPVPSVVRSEPNHTRTRPRHVRNIILLVTGKCSQNGMKVGVRCFYVVGRPPVNFRRIRSSFDAPTNNYSSNIVGLSSDVFDLRKQSPGLPLFSSLSSRPSAQSTSHCQALPNLSRQSADLLLPASEICPGPDPDSRYHCVRIIP